MKNLKNNKIFTGFLIICILLAGLICIPFAEDDKTTEILSKSVVLNIGSSDAYVNNKPVQIDPENCNIAAIVKGGRTFVPLRFVAESFGADIKWDAAKKQAVITQEETKIVIQPGSRNIEINSNKIEADAAAEVYEGRIIIPLRKIAEAFGKEVYYDKGLIILSDDKLEVDITCIENIRSKFKTIKDGKEAVSLTDKGNYFYATLDFSGKLSHREMGRRYAEAIKKAVPDFEALVDSLLVETTINDDIYRYIIMAVNDIKPQIPEEYREEIEGMAAAFSGGDKGVRGDNKLSLEELYIFNLTPDVSRPTQCSAVSVFGSRSETKKTITARNLDWYSGSSNQLGKIQAVITIENKNSKICSIGYLGYMGIITGFNDSKVFAAIIDSSSGAPYNSSGKRSYPFDLRYALENKTTLEQVGEFMRDGKKNYAFNHLIYLSDPDKSKVLENNISGTGANMRRELRDSKSALNKGVTWDISDATGCVNSFLLAGNHDNHTLNLYNTARWDKMKETLLSKGEKVTADELKEVITFDNNNGPGAMDTGDIYNDATQQSIIFQPDTFSLEIFFRPKDTLKMPADPVFEKVSVFEKSKALKN